MLRLYTQLSTKGVGTTLFLRKVKDSNLWNAHHVRLFSRQVQSSTLPTFHRNRKHIKTDLNRNLPDIIRTHYSIYAIFHIALKLIEIAVCFLICRSGGTRTHTHKALDPKSSSATSYDTPRIKASK